MSLDRVELRGSWTVFIDFHENLDSALGVTAARVWASPFGIYEWFDEAPEGMRLLWRADMPMARLVEFLERYKIADPAGVIAERFPRGLLARAYRTMEYPS